MNIFMLHKEPAQAAMWHCNKHVVSQVLETAMILSAAHHFHQTPFTDQVYKPTHLNHPISAWVQNGTSNYNWTYILFKELLSEYNYRYGKTHASTRLIPALGNIPESTPIAWTRPYQAMPEDLRNISPVKGYQNYYRYKYHDCGMNMEWKKRRPPHWISKHK